MLFYSQKTENGACHGFPKENEFESIHFASTLFGRFRLPKTPLVLMIGV